MMYFCILAAIICIFTLVRNQAVYLARIQMLDLIASRGNVSYYLSVYGRSVSYDDMLFHFWVWPVSKMFPKELQELMENDR
jgi:hypothetical protein